MKSLIAGTCLTMLAPFSAVAEPAYLIAQIQVDDWDSFMTNYGGAAIPTVMEYGGKVLVGGPGTVSVEGDWPGNHTVVIEFESMEMAQAWYDDADYEAARPLRFQDTSLNNLAFAPGFVPPAQ